MKANVVICDAKILNVEDKVAVDKLGKDIRWTEVVIMQGTNVSTVNIDKEVAKQLNIDGIYDLVMEISEQIKATSYGKGFINHKFKIIGTAEF